MLEPFRSIVGVGGMEDKARFVIANTMLFSLLVISWRLGYLRPFGMAGGIEIVSGSVLASYGAFGMWLVFTGQFENARHVANQLPIWGLSFTGTAFMVAIFQIASTHLGRTEILLDVAVAIAPNVIATALLAWLREVAWWASREVL